MGTDIHVFVEQRNTNGEWEYCGLYDCYRNSVYNFTTNDWERNLVVEPANIFNIRNYDLFNLLTGRWDGYEDYSIVPWHGKPEDMSEEVYEMTLDPETGEPGQYYFNFNYLTITELETVFETLYLRRKVSKDEKAKYNTFKPFFDIVTNAVWQSQNHNAGHNDTRIVYWFDN